MLVTLGTAFAQQPLRPELILDVGAPEEVNAQPNFPLADPHHQLVWFSLGVFLPYQHLEQRSQAERILLREQDVG